MVTEPARVQKRDAKRPNSAESGYKVYGFSEGSWVWRPNTRPQPRRVALSLGGIRTARGAKPWERQPEVDLRCGSCGRESSVSERWPRL